MQSFGKNIIQPGHLYVVATPIGHLGDITLRALEILGSVAWIAAEDTRHTHKLLQHYSITTRLVSYHQFNEQKKSGSLVARLQSGEAGALVSDAGTPLMCDPGSVLVAAAAKAGITVLAVPGPCACVAALSVAGLSDSRFVFEGFLPSKGSERRKRLELLGRDIRTVIFYEAPHRLKQLLQELNDSVGGGRFVVIARELTKIHESVYRGCISELQEALEVDLNLERGEFVVMLSGCVEEAAVVDDKVLHVFRVLSGALPKGEALKLTSQITGVRKNVLYRHILPRGI